MPFHIPEAKEDSLRQRENQTGSGVEEIQQEVTDEILRASIERSKRDKLWTSIIYVIVAVIALLVLRRVLFT